MEKTIQKLEEQNLAQWYPGARTSDIFAGPSKNVPATKLFRSLYLYITIILAALFAFRFISRKHYRDKVLCGEFALILLTMLLLLIS